MSESESESVSVFEFEFVFEGGRRERVRFAETVPVCETAIEPKPGAEIRSPAPRRLLPSHAMRSPAGDAIARRIPGGYASLADQLRRALLSCFLGIAEAVQLEATDSPAFAARVAKHRKPEHLLSLLDRLCAMLARLAGLSHRPAETRD